MDLLAQRLGRGASACLDAAVSVRRADAVHWEGAAASAHREASTELRLHLAAYGDEVSVATRALAAYAAELRFARDRERQGHQLLDDAAAATEGWRWNTDPAGTSDPGEPDRARASVLLTEAAEIVATAATGLSRLLDQLLPQRSARPVPTWPAWMSQLAGGTAEATVALGTQIRYSTPQFAALDPSGTREYYTTFAKSLWTGVQHPKELGKAVVDWDTWASEPSRAVGHLVPGAVLLVATGGASRVADASARLSKIPPSLRRGPHRLRDINKGRKEYDNCPSCVIATDQTLGGAPSSALPNWQLRNREIVARYGGTMMWATPEWIVESLAKAGPGARGIIFGIREGRPGHVFNAVNERGRVYVIDGQTGEAGVFQDNYIDYFFMRTDGLTPLGAVAKEAR